MTKLLIASLAFTILGTPPLHAEDPALYKSWHDTCLTGDTGDIDAVIARYEARLKKNPADHLAQAYLGSACALRARESFWGPTKLKFLKRGKSLLDSAVAAAPDNPRVRMIRAIAYLKVPEKFGTRPTSLADFRVLIPIARPAASNLTPAERQAILYHAWLAHQEAADPSAADLKAACHRIAPDSSYGRLTK